MEKQIRDSSRDKRICDMYKQGYTYKQIAEELCVTSGRIGQLYRRILADKGLTWFRQKRKKAA